MKKFTIIFFLISFNLFGQRKSFSFIDSMTYDFNQKGEWWFSFDFKNTFVSDLPVKMFGMQLGKQYNSRTSWYIGYYNAPDVFKIYENPTAGSGKTDSNTVYQGYALSYFNFGLEYEFKDSRRWRFYVPLSLGIGGSREKITSEKKVFKEKYNTTIPLETGIYGSYKLLWWLWISGGIGSRIDLNTKSGFNGSFYTLGLNIRYIDIYRRVKKKLSKE